MSSDFIPGIHVVLRHKTAKGLLIFLKMIRKPLAVLRRC